MQAALVRQFDLTSRAEFLQDFAKQAVQKVSTRFLQAIRQESQTGPRTKHRTIEMIVRVETSPPIIRDSFPAPEQTIAGIGRALREGRTSCVEILEGCLQQVDEWEPKVHAWVILDRDEALEQARELR